jgi:predicted transposase/invertase (TIGR01784 family)
MGRKLVSFDWAMKKILREKANFEILEGFLTELLKFDVKIEEVLESEANQETESDKFNRVDLLAKNENEELILIEIQYDSEIDYFHRMVYGSSKLISQYLLTGEEYAKIKKVYSVNIIYFDLGQGDDYIYYGKTEFLGLHKKDILKFSQTQKESFPQKEVFEIFPEYYILKINNFNDIAKNSLDEWIYFLKNEEILTQTTAKGLELAKEKLDMLKLSETDRAIYKRRQENLSYKNSMLWSAEQKGVEKGKKEEKIEIAKNLLANNIDISVIAISTGLSEKEILELR